MKTPQNEPADLEAFVRAPDVATLLGVRVSWVYAQAGRGAIPSYRVGRYLRFRLSEVVQTLDAYGPPRDRGAGDG